AVSGITAANKVYDGKTSATLNTSAASLAGIVSGDSVTVAGGTGVFADKNVGVGKTVSISGLSLGGADAGNYTLGASAASTSADISKATISGVSGITIKDKVYDGTTLATTATAGANFAGLISGDQVTLGTLNAVFADRNAGTGKTVNLTNLVLSGADSGNYTLAGTIAPATGNITVRPLATWTASSGGSWGSAGNWDALPDGSNVLAVSIPSNVSVTYDLPGSTTLQSFGGAGTLSVASGNLSIAGGLTTPQYSQSGGTLNLGGAFNVNGSFSQTAGQISTTGPVVVTQSSGNLNVGAITAPAISLNATSGSIGQSGALVTSGLLATQSSGSTLLNNAGNRIAAFRASSSGVGDIGLTNFGVMDVQGISTASGNITVVDTGGISTSGKVVANGGKVSMTANSPLTIGTDGVTATGDIALVATNLTSSGNMTLNGPLVSSAGAVSMNAASNFVQNSSVTAAAGIAVSAGGTVTLGPSATSVGNPVSYTSSGAAVAAPVGSKTSGGGAPTDFVVTFLAQFEKTVVEPEQVTKVVVADPLNPSESGKAKEKKGLAVEGEICAR
ncbi:MAG: YDG domain-containing protein, partial [Comamonadaceae bacterium]